jgi:hypothetical protein
VRVSEVAVDAKTCPTGYPDDVLGVAVTTYPVMLEPPFDDGAVHDAVTDPLPPVAVTPLGAPGTVTAVTVIVC